MTLPRNTDFTTADPQQLRTDLQVEHRDIVAEFARVLALIPSWTVVLVGTGQTVRAVPNGFYIGSGFTIYTPGRPTPGTVFRVCETTTTATTNVLTDDGTLIGGAAPPSGVGAGVRGWFEFVYVASALDPSLAGWWRNR